MDNVQKVNNCITTRSSRTFRSYSDTELRKHFSAAPILFILFYGVSMTSMKSHVLPFIVLYNFIRLSLGISRSLVILLAPDTIFTALGLV
jgi:hypothetical protein